MIDIDLDAWYFRTLTASLGLGPDFEAAWARFKYRFLPALPSPKAPEKRRKRRLTPTPVR